VNRPGPDHPVAAAFERRAARAEGLAARCPSAVEPLRFAAGLYRVQARLAGTLAARHAARPLRGRLGEDAETVLLAAAELLRFAGERGPAVLAAEARACAVQATSTLAARLAASWSGEPTAATDYLSRAVLRPYVEVLAFLCVPPDRPHPSGTCPFCGGPPWIAARRAGPEGEGARRHLGCALCGGEWRLSRVLCPNCGEEDPARLPSFASETCPAARIEACETCRGYVKSIDLTLDGHAIPEVDDLASVVLDLWAASEGFARIEPGLAGPVTAGRD